MPDGPKLRERLVLLAIVCLGLWLRLDGITFGLDFAEQENLVLDRVDENGMVSAVHEALVERDLDPRDFLIRGPGGFLVFLVADLPVLGCLALRHPLGWDGVLADLRLNPSPMQLTHRVVAALAGTLSVWLLYRIVRREFGAPSALCSAAILAVAYLNVQDSHVGGVDTLWALFSLGAVGWMLAIVRAPERRAYALAGFFTGLAVATKYFAVLLGPVLLLAHVQARAEARRRGDATPPLSRLVLASAAVPLGFLALFPGVFTAWRHLHATVSHAAGFSSPRWTVAALSEKVVDHGVYSLGVGLGEGVFVLALLGLAFVWRRGATGRLLVSAMGVLVLGLFLTRNSPPRYAESLAVLLAGGAGLTLTALLARVPRPVGVLLVALALAPSLVRSVAYDRLIDRRDTRLDMLAELRRRGVPRNEVLAFGSHFGMPRPASGTLPYRSLRTIVFGRPWKNEPSVPIEEAQRRFRKALASPPRLVLWNRSQQTEIAGTAEMVALLRSRYRVVLKLDGRKRELALPDPVTMDMIPYVQPWLMERPGPALVLYERTELPRRARTGS